MRRDEASTQLLQYCEKLSGLTSTELQHAAIFAKCLTPNDDSGRHGLLIAAEAYDFFPPLQIRNVDQNETIEFAAFDGAKRQAVMLAYKYYQRYPERRITRLNAKFNDVSKGQIVAIFLRVQRADKRLDYFVDCIYSAEDNFAALVTQIFGAEIALAPGKFVQRDIVGASFVYDAPLLELMQHFDRVKEMGWIKTLRAGDTGVGYTFETLIGLKENNRQEADFKGIEIKCKQKKDGQTKSGKINLFQLGPIWREKIPSKTRIEHIGAIAENGRFACYSQVTTVPNNLFLSLAVEAEEQRIDLLKNKEVLGDWLFAALQKSLLKKHARAAFIKAEAKQSGGEAFFRYDEVIYCERPSIQNFVALVEKHNVVFEFTMSQKENGTVRNHGYPWRLTREDLLRDLFAFRTQLR
jgi:MvaI/BcnI restriction endonuclease family